MTKEIDKDLVEKADQMFRKWQKERQEPFKFPSLRKEIAKAPQDMRDEERKLSDELMEQAEKALATWRKFKEGMK